MPMPSLNANVASIPNHWPDRSGQTVVALQKLAAPSAMALACTPGIRKPAAAMVASANAHAYHFRPRPFSM